ncbi:MAG: methyltransferase [Candidatus Margulisiibacteriota bacterium]
MYWQLLVVLIFALNLALLWSDKLAWWRLPGSLICAVLPLVTVFIPQPSFELDYFWWRIVGGVAIVAGAALIVWAQMALGRGLTNIGGTPAKLVTEGPYAFFRHPIYLGLIFVWVGWWWVFAAVYSFYGGMFILAAIWLQGYFEEKFVLEKSFGSKFKEYRQQTGMFWVK